MDTVSVIIPTLFPAVLLEQYVEKLTKYTNVSEVIVVVNGKDTLHQSQGVKSKTISLGKNIGFTGACNAGARIATEEYILFLNDDCEMSEDALNTMIQFLQKNNDVVATQPIVTKVTVSSDSEQVENIGFWIDTKIGKAHPIVSQEEIEGLRDESKIYGLSGTCLLIRKGVFEKLGMWDESFHSYLEDVDLGIRLHKAGFKVEACLGAYVSHKHMATSSQLGFYKEKQDVINWWRLVIKHPDVFIQSGNIFSLLIERSRNVSGLIKKIVRT